MKHLVFIFIVPLPTCLCLLQIITWENLFSNKMQLYNLLTRAAFWTLRHLFYLSNGYSLYALNSLYLVNIELKLI